MSWETERDRKNRELVEVPPYWTWKKGPNGNEPPPKKDPTKK